MSKNIGGFFELHPEETAKPNSLLALWDTPEHSHWMFANGRSALHHLLLLHVKPKTFWLPAYCCTSLAEAVTGTGAALRFFPLHGLSPDCDYLQKHLSSGDAVLAINYFGRNPDAAFLEWRATRTDIHWIEDRAQALLPSPTAWGDYLLYSPRKLLGIPDGGILVSMKGALPEITYDDAIEPDATHPVMLRHADTEEMQNAIWYAAYVATETAMKVSRRRMSQASQRLLHRVNLPTMTTKRKANYAALMNRLGDIALLPDDAMDFVPFGFPIRIKERQKIASHLHAHGVFAAHHWPEMPSPIAFKAEHALAAEELTLPCDHRYEIADMERIAKLVRATL